MREVRGRIEKGGGLPAGFAHWARWAVAPPAFSLGLVEGDKWQGVWARLPCQGNKERERDRVEFDREIEIVTGQKYLTSSTSPFSLARCKG